MANDDTIILNKGVGGDITDASNVAAGPIKRERVVIGGDASRAQITDLVTDSGIWRFPVAIGPVDAFGRQRNALPQTIFESKLLNDAQPLFWSDAQISGAGTTSTYNTNQSSVTLAVSAATAGMRARQTFRRFGYQVGKSQSYAFSGIIGANAAGITRRIGAFDTNNGLFFENSPAAQRVIIRSFTSGAPVDTAVAQAAWNIDPMDGTGPSGLTIDFTKIQNFIIDYQWFGTVRFGFNVGGTFYYCHASQNANLTTLVFMSTPNLPIRYEISNDGTGGAANMLQISSTAISEGGLESIGVTRAATRGSTSFVTLNNSSLYPLIAIRLRSGFEGASIKLLLASVVCTSTTDLETQILLNPTVTGTALSFTAITNSVIESDVATTNATTVSGGTLLNSIVGAASSNQIALSQPSDFQIGSSVIGVNDILVLAVRRLTGAAETFFASLNWRESN